MDEQYWRERDALARYNLSMYAQQLAYYSRLDEQPLIEEAIAGINMAQTMRKICAHEIAALQPTQPQSPIFGKGRD